MMVSPYAVRMAFPSRSTNLYAARLVFTGISLKPCIEIAVSSLKEIPQTRRRSRYTENRQRGKDMDEDF